MSKEARVWSVLLGLTGANWLLMEYGLWYVTVERRVLGTAILALALVKVRLIVRRFMEVREAPRPLSWIMDSWLVVVFVSLYVQAWITAA